MPSQNGLPITDATELDRIRSVLTLGNDPRAARICTGEQALSVVNHQGMLVQAHVSGKTQRVRVNFVTARALNQPPPPPPSSSDAQSASEGDLDSEASTVGTTSTTPPPATTRPAARPRAVPAFRITAVAPWQHHEHHIFEPLAVRASPTMRPTAAPQTRVHRATHELSHAPAAFRSTGTSGVSKVHARNEAAGTMFCFRLHIYRTRLIEFFNFGCACVLHSSSNVCVPLLHARLQTRHRHRVAWRPLATR